MSDRNGSLNARRVDPKGKRCHDDLPGFQTCPTVWKEVGGTGKREISSKFSEFVVLNEELS